MIWHPLTWAFWVAAATGTALYAIATGCAVDVALNWRPDHADHGQLRCERHAQMASLLGRWALGILAAAALIGLVGISRVWHRIIPGAMCGTGVLQAMGIYGSQALIFWGLLLALFWGWSVGDRLDQSRPQSCLAETGARLLIAVCPILVLALFHTWQAVMQIDGAPPVSCCAAVYDRILNNDSGLATQSRAISIALWSSLSGIAILPLVVMMAVRYPHGPTGGIAALLAIAWTGTSTVAVKHTWSAYYYQVLSHPCPWCLFLPDYNGAGFLIFGCLAIILLESIALWTAGRIRSHAPLVDPADQRMRQAVWRIVVALVGFTLLTAGPAILWRLRTGVWMDGT
ncbi:hypothetical protein [Desulfosarcina ovata]|uniref:Uncharacterized protein n=1 Tax=Desulfosarcina ovata subsp. ovata TaxID=2752305 RepID=A0A5K8AFP5_9BACT|nr:hypothetical protein [Desulfosarcina ovata]BBO91437.1 hypothetical protein DSCOOX_46170 [Desulfosarcina ovata subsp. ovata]